MILRKPYAFLIKHFRAIHFLMVLLISYVIFSTLKIFLLIGDYLDGENVFYGYEDISGQYVGIFLLFIVVALIIVSAVILYLMKHKKKPSFYYIFTIIVYIITLASLIYASNFIYDLQFFDQDIRLTQIIRDIFFLELVVQVPTLILAFVRTVGFDIKKFDFKKDLLELDIAVEDNAEFEFNVNLDTEDVRAKARKKYRYFKYYYQENKVVFIVLGGIISFVLLTFIIVHVSSIEKIYNQQEVFNTRRLEIQVLESYKTYNDYKGNKINNKYFYVILKMRYKNASTVDVGLSLDNARLSYAEYYNIAPTTLMYNKFVEFGTPYYSQIITSGETRDFILVYEVDKRYYDEEFNLKYLYDIESVNNQAEYKYRVVSLKLQEFEDKEKIEEKELGEELTFSDSLIGNTKIVINNIDLSNKYTYNLVRCKNDECNKYINYMTPSTNKVYETTLMRINYNLVYDKALGSTFSISNFIEKFGSIRFVIDGKEYENKIDLTDVTPYPTDNYAYIEVRERLNRAEKIYLDFTIRDKAYTYIIKDEAE